LAYLYKQKEENFEQGMSNKNVVLLQTSWGTYWEQQKPKRKHLPHPTPPFPKEITPCLLDVCCIASLAEHNFYSFLCLSPFLTKDNGKDIQLGGLFFYRY
jgi:hypothetical protein